MKFFHHFTIILLCLQVLPTFAARPGTQDKHTLSSADAQKIRDVVNETREAIRNNNTKEFLRHVSVKNGLTCTDTDYAYKDVNKFLKEKSSYLYISLFDSSEFSKRCGDGYPKEYPAIAEKEFLQAAYESIKISKLDNDTVEVLIESPIKTHYPRKWYLHREAQSWKVTGGSFIIGECTCGG
jgi:hypothetical protein